MRRSRGAGVRGFLFAITALGIGLAGCDPQLLFSEGQPPPVSLRPMWSRATLRAYDGAPPVIPHRVVGGAACRSCHDQKGRTIAGFGVAPPSPHEKTSGMAAARCEQCHVAAEVQDEFVASQFQTRWWSGTRKGSRLYPAAPPVAPHRLFMHEDCGACHAGPAAPPEIRTTHPDRGRCLQCHAFVQANVQASDEFVR